jgi:7-carboxy-7-deazaguanine synthase
MLKLSEIFLSIQGESTYAGLPCIFIRLAGCNLQCRYCDTTYSYETKFEKSVEQVLEIIKKYDPVKLVEITGGEPLIQSEIYDLFTILNDNDYEILLETNGTIDLKKVPDYVIKIVDVKCPGSGEENSFLLENLEFINKEKDEIKFVLSDNFDYNWSKDFVMKYNLINYEILFSPILDKLEPQELAKWITEDKLPVRMQLQLHKLIWGKDRKGV